MDAASPAMGTWSPPLFRAAGQRPGYHTLHVGVCTMG